MTGGTFVDTNVLLDVVTADPVWGEWSVIGLEQAADRGPLFINSVVFAELSISFDTVEQTRQAVASFGLTMSTIPEEALFAAGRAFLAYRRRGGLRSSVLPDFFIGAHALALGVPLLTRDGRRYRVAYPDLILVRPQAT